MLCHNISQYIAPYIPMPLIPTVTAACISYIRAAICVDCDSNHVCIAPDTCVCPDGWMGDDCMQGTQLVFLSFFWLYIAVQ